MPSNNRQDSFKDNEQNNALWEYVKSLSPESTARLSQPETQDVFQIVEHNIVGLLGSIPNENFDVEITTSKKQLGRMLASAMMTGYFLRNAEQRLNFEESLLLTQSDNLKS